MLNFACMKKKKEPVWMPPSAMAKHLSKKMKYPISRQLINAWKSDKTKLLTKQDEYGRTLVAVPE